MTGRLIYKNLPLIERDLNKLNIIKCQRKTIKILETVTTDTSVGILKLTTQILVLKHAGRMTDVGTSVGTTL